MTFAVQEIGLLFDWPALPNPGNRLCGRQIGWFSGPRDNNSRIPETDFRDPETETRRLETEKRTHRIHDILKHDYKGSLAALWPPQGRLADTSKSASTSGISDFVAGFSMSALWRLCLVMRREMHFLVCGARCLHPTKIKETQATITKQWFELYRRNVGRYCVRWILKSVGVACCH